MTTNLAGSVVATTANTAPVALAADEAMTKFKALTTGCNVTLQGLPVNQKVLLVTATVYYNYLETLEGYSSASYLWTDTEGRTMFINGAAVLNFRGTPVVNMNWDTDLNADFPTAYPHRVIFTEMNNLVNGMDTTSEYSLIETWYTKDDQENRFRMQYKAGTQYVEDQYVAIAY